MNSSKPIKKGQIEDYISPSTQTALDLKVDKVAGERLINVSEIVKLSNTSNINSGDQTSIVGISGTKAQFNTAVTDGDILFVGDVNASTNLTYTPSAINGTIVSDTGTDATIPLADNTNAGLISPTEKSKITTALQSSDISGLVPYIGATTNVDLGEFQIKTGQLEFDTTPTGTFGVGKVRWNDVDGTIDIGLKGGNVTLQVGQEQVLRAVNKTGSNLLESDYHCVYISGAQGNRLKVDLALSNNTINSNKTIGLVTENINNNQEGFITTIGLVRDINTTGSLQGETWIDGDVLYLSSTTPGHLTNILPISPNHKIIVGYVVRAHATQGSIFVKVDTGLAINELHDTKVTGTTANKLIGSTTEGLWENKTVSDILGYTPENISNKDNGILTTSTTTYPTSYVVKSAIDLKANIDSPTFTGTPTAPTATVGTNTTQLATTAFVLANVGSSPWTTTGNDIANSNSGNVGIGTTSPIYKLDVRGDLISGVAPSYFSSFKPNYTTPSSGSYEQTVMKLRPSFNIPSGVSQTGLYIGVYSSILRDSALDNGNLSYLHSIAAIYGHLPNATGYTANANGLTVHPYHQGGSIGTSKALYLENSSGGITPTNYWAIYQEDNLARNYFSGRNLIGTTTDNGVDALQVTGSVGLNTAPTTSASGYDILTRNTSTGKVEKIASSGLGGDMLLGTAQTVSAIKTFLNGTLGLRNVANTFTSLFTNTNTASRTYTLPDKSMTVAGTDDIAIVPLNEGNGIGYVIGGRNAANYGNIGLKAFDISNYDNTSSIYGATGTLAFAGGDTVKSSGFASFSFGLKIINEANGGTSFGWNSSNRGWTNSIFGIGHDIKSMNATVVGQASEIVDIQIVDWNASPSSKPMFIVGNGTIANADSNYTVLSRSNAFKVMMDGSVLAPSLTISLINSESTGKVVTTKEYVDSKRVQRLAQYTVSTLPTGVQGDNAYVTDALAPTYMATVVGGGSVVTPVFHNGSSWIAH
jgi:hypothetical protein